MKTVIETLEKGLQWAKDCHEATKTEMRTKDCPKKWMEVLNKRLLELEKIISEHNEAIEKLKND